MPNSFTLTPEQRHQFLEDGLVRVPGAVPAEAVEAMADRIWAALARQLGALRDQPQTWTHEGQPQLKQMSHAGVFAAMFSPGVRALLDDFFGERGWRPPPKFEPRPLGVIFPTPGRPWNVPTRHWHLDRVGSDPTRPADVADRPWPGCVRLFACLGAVEPGGGGTFYVSGSHRAVNLVVSEMRATQDRIPSAMIVKRLKRDSPWIADLCSKGEEKPGRVERFMHEGAEFRGVPLRVAEMTGQPGDLILWQPNLLHTYSPANCLSTPLLVLSATIDANGDVGSSDTLARAPLR
ncbi:MAG: phytanoyl-CoA dioxygenase family protein [Caulobacterales bacterium]